MARWKKDRLARARRGNPGECVVLETKKIECFKKEGKLNSVKSYWKGEDWEINAIGFNHILIIGSIIKSYFWDDMIIMVKEGVGSEIFLIINWKINEFTLLYFGIRIHPNENVTCEGLQKKAFWMITILKCWTYPFNIAVTLQWS